MKIFLLKSRFFKLFFLLINLIFASGVYSQTVTTDLLDYSPGSTAIITGAGFQAGETVTLLVEHVGEEPVGTDPQYHQPWTVVADSLGSFTSSWYVPTVAQGDALDATLLLTADGNTSLLHAEWTFTDAGALSVGGSSAPVSFSISADNAKNASVPSYTSLGNIVIKEATGKGGQGDFATSFSQITLTAPSGWEFKTSGVTVSKTGNDINVAPTISSISTTTIIISFGINGIVDNDVITISGVSIISTNGAINPNSGNISFSFDGSIASLTTPLTMAPLTQVVGALKNFRIESSAGGSIPDQTAGTAFNIKLTARDQFNNTVTTFNGGNNKAVISSNAILTSGSGTTAAFTNGVLASHSVTIDPTFSNATITAANGGATGLSNQFNVTGSSGSLTVTAPTCAQGGSFTITYSPASGPDVTETKTTPFAFNAKKNTAYSITSIQSPVNGNVFTGSSTVTGTTPNINNFTQTTTLGYSDNTAPIINCPANISVACGASILPANIGTATATDNCTASGTIIISYTDNVAPPGACGGTILRTWKAKDGSNNESLCIQTITVSPAPLPTMTAPASITVACGALPAASTLPFSNGLSGGCEVSGTSNASTFSAIPNACGGEVTETWTATDACGRALSSVSRTITVSPAPLPTMTAPAAITVACGALPAASTLPFSNGLSGGCEVSGTSNASTFSAIPNACGGEVTETWTATDACGRALSSVSRTITVSPATLPTMTAPAAITVACGALPAASTLPFTNGLSGGCEVSGTSNASTFSAILNACGGEVTETWTATDACGRALASVSRTITVSPATLPTMTAPGNIEISCLSQLPAPSTRFFSNNLINGCLISGSSNASTFTTTPTCNGIITETWTATDNCGRSLAQISRIITLTRTGAPTISNCPANITVSTGAGSATCNQTATWTAPTATTSCGEVANVSSSHNSGDTFPVGTTTVTYTFTDCASNTSKCSFTVTVVDNTKPIITTNGNKSVNNATNVCGATVVVSALATDNCGVGTPSGVRSDNLALNAVYPVGVTTIMWNVNDSNGNAAVAVAQTVTVTDNQAPVITTCPTPKTGVYTNFAGCTYKHSGIGWDAVASDNCAVTSIKYTLSGSSTIYTSLDNVVFNSGLTTVTAIAYDAAGNASAPCSFTVTVISTLSATITPSKKYVYFGAPGDQTATITATPSGGMAPYTVKITMQNDLNAPVDPAAVRTNGKLICGFINSSGNEVWSSSNSIASTGISCSTNTVTASSTSAPIPINGSYSVNVTLLANAKFIATVTDVLGCTYTIPYEQAAYVIAEDARCFAGKSGIAKVKLCHQTGSAKNPCMEICVDESAVAAHIAHGDFLGKCTTNCTNPALTKPVVIGKELIVDSTEFNAIVYPNPSNHQFNVGVSGGNEEQVEVVVYDMLARLVKKIVKPTAKEIQFGEELPSGEYLLLIRQGSNQKAMNVIKK